MIGLEAISANNGWAMAITGIIIVMSGLAILSFIISQIHKVIGLFEKKKVSRPSITELPPDLDALKNPEAAAEIYQLMTIDMGESFQLVKLYEFFEEKNIPHPHLTISTLREAGYLLPLGAGLFSWKKE